MSTAKSHPTLNYFKKTDEGNWISCNKCCIQITCPKSGTTNMIQHLQRKHLGLHKMYGKEKKKLTSKNKKTRKRKPLVLLNHLEKKTKFAYAPIFTGNDPWQTSFIRAIAEKLPIDIEPFSKEEHRGLRNLLYKFEPRYKIPSRTTFSRSNNPEKFEWQQNRVKEEIISFLTSLALTADICSTKRQNCLNDITCLFVDKKFKNINSLLDTHFFPERHTYDKILAKMILYQRPTTFW